MSPQNTADFFQLFDLRSLSGERFAVPFVRCERVFVGWSKWAAGYCPDWFPAKIVYGPDGRTERIRLGKIDD